MTEHRDAARRSVEIPGEPAARDLLRLFEPTTRSAPTLSGSSTNQAATMLCSTRRDTSRRIRSRADGS
jgi:hypothetical protein